MKEIEGNIIVINQSYVGKTIPRVDKVEIDIITTIPNTLIFTKI